MTQARTYKRSDMKKLLITILCAGTLTACINDDKEEPREQDVIRVGQKLPQFSVTTSDGTEISTQTLLGRRSVAVFFNTTCPDCQRELPRIDSLYRAHQNDALFILVCIARDQQAEPIQAFWEAKGLVMPYSPQTGRKVYELFARSVIPRIYIASTDGVVRYMHDDQDMPTFQQLNDELESID